MTTLASTDFTGTNGAAWPAAFSNARNTGGSTTIDTNRGQQTTSAAGGYADYRADYLNFGTTTDGTLTGTFMTPDLNEKFAQVWFRANTTALGTPGGGGGSGYFFSLEPSYNTIRFYKRTTGTQAGLGTAVSFTFAANTIYSWKVQWFGTTLRAKIWTGSEPGTWNASITDASFGSAGYCGLALDGGAAAAARQVFWDDIVLDNNAVSLAATAVARAAAIPTPAISLGVTASPSSVSRAAAVPAPTVNIGPNATINPATVARTALVPTPTVLAIGNVTVTPPAVARSVQITAVAPFTGQGITVPATAVPTAATIGPHTIQTLTLMPGVTVATTAGMPTPAIDTTGIARLDLLTDRFSFDDTGKWFGFEQPEAATSGGLLEITPSSATNFTITSAFNYSLAESYAYIEVPNPLLTGTFTTIVRFGNNTDNVGFTATGGNLIFRERVGGVNSDTSVAYSATDHRWWRFAKTGTTLVWQTSTDGIVWTTRRSKTTTLPLDNTQFTITAGRSGAESAATARFDNLNLPAVVPAPAETPLPDVGCWFEAYDLNTGEFQARVEDFWDAAILDPIDEIGLGTLNLSRTAWSISALNPDGSPNMLPNGKAATTLFSQAYRWFFIENGARRFSFISEVNDKVIAKKEDNDDNVTISGPGVGLVMSWGVALPSNLSIAATSRIYTNTNWASVWIDLLNEAKSRGAIPIWVTPTFDQYIDSNGESWPDYGDYEIKPGENMLALLQTFAGSIGFSWRMTPDGYVVAAQSYGVDRSATVRFYEGHDIWEAEDHIVGTDVRSDVFIEGGDGMVTQAYSVDTRNEWGHREVYVQANAALGPTVSNIFAQGTLAQVRKPVIERQFAIDWNPVDDAGVSLGRRVYVDYGPGDIIGYNDNEVDGSSNFKLISIALKVDSAGQITEEIVAESKREQIVEKVKRLLQQSLGGNYVAGIGLGNDVTGGSAALDSAIGDASIPGVPTITSVNSASTLVEDGTEQAQATVAWSEPLNTDASEIVDGDHYEIGYKLVSSIADYTVVNASWDQTSIAIDGLVPNTQYQFRIRAVDYAIPVNAGDWSGPIFHTTWTDFTPPEQPAAPTVATNILSVQIVHTLGQAAGGTYNLPIDLDHLEVHQGSTFNFAVSPATLIGKLPANYSLISGGIPAIGTFPILSTAFQYFKVVAVDKTGNRSVASPSAGSTATLVSNSYITDLTVTKLLAGTLSVAVTLSGSIKTGTSGSRVEMDAAGIRLYNSGGTVVVNLNASTGAGTFAGALSGATGTFSGSLSGATGTFSGNLSAATITASTIIASSFQSSSGSQYVSIDDSTNSQRINFGNNGDSGYIEAVNDGQDQIRIQSSSGTWIGCLNGTASLNTGNGVVSANDNGAIITSTGGGNAYFYADNSNANTYAAGNVNINSDNGAYISGNNINMSANEINIGNGSSGQKMVSGSVYNNTSTFAANVGIATTPYANFYRLTSSRRYKVCVETLKGDPYAVLKMRPVTYYDKKQWVDNKFSVNGLSKQVGFIAEEVAVLDTIGTLLTELDDQEIVSAVNYERVVAPVILAIQDMARRLDRLEATSMTR